MGKNFKIIKEEELLNDNQFEDASKSKIFLKRSSSSKSNKKTVKLIFYTTIISAIFILYGLVMINSGNSDTKECTESVRATVTKYYEKNGAGKKRNTTYYYPVYSFVYNNITYELKDDDSSIRPKYNIGKDVILYINQDDPYHFYVKGENKTFTGYVIIVISASVLIIMLYLKIKQKRRESTQNEDTF